MNLDNFNFLSFTEWQAHNKGELNYILTICPDCDGEGSSQFGRQTKYTCDTCDGRSEIKCEASAFVRNVTTTIEKLAEFLNQSYSHDEAKKYAESKFDDEFKSKLGYNDFSYIHRTAKSNRPVKIKKIHGSGITISQSNLSYFESKQ